MAIYIVHFAKGITIVDSHKLISTYIKLNQRHAS